MKKLTRWERIKYTNDWGTVFKAFFVLLFIGLISVLMLNRNYFETKIAGNFKKGIASGYVINRIEHTELHESIHNGNQFNVDAITFYYSYTVNDVVYHGNEQVSYSVVNAQLRKMANDLMPYPIVVHYDLKDPQQSIIWFE